MESSKTSDKDLFFVDMSLRLFWSLLLARFFNWRIYVFDIGKNLTQSALLRKMHKHKWIVRVVEHSSIPFGQSHSIAIKLADKIISNRSNDKSIQLLKNLCKSKEVDLVFKRNLVQHLSLLTSFNQYISTNKEIRNPIFFISRKYSKILQKNPEILDTSIAISFVRHWGIIRLWKNWIIVVFGYLIHLLIQFSYKASPQKKVFKFAISVPFPWAVKFKGAREFTFLVDDKIIKKDDVVFLVEYPESKELYKEYSNAGYTLQDAVSIKRIGNLFRESTLQFRHDFLYIIKILLSYKRDFIVYEALASLLFYRISWSVIVAQTPFKNYIYFNKEGSSQISTNIFLKQQQIRTHAYSQFIGGPYIVCGSDSIFDKRDILWSFLNPDYFYLNSQAMVESMLLHFQDTVRHKVIGGVFSEKIVEIKDNRSHIEKISSKYNVNRSKQVISIFDTTYLSTENIYSNYDEAKCFLKDSIKLAKHMPKSFFLFKPSKPDSRFLDVNSYWFDEKGVDIVRLRHELNQLPNAVMLDDNSDVVDVIGVSDIVFTNCFSSPTAEALLANIPAFWYQATTDVSFSVFNKIPGLVVNGYKALVEKINLIQQENYLTNFDDNVDYINLIGDPSKKALTDLRLDLNANS